ncbi:MAG: signal peptidase II [Elusimicrobia bacterium]|nr:signal peptidase II [Elusimicrobiota bacterium]
MESSGHSLKARASVALLLLALDRAAKLWAASALRGRDEIELLPFFGLSYVENTGAAFGLGRGANGFFVAASVVLIAVLVRLMRRWRGPRLEWGGILVLTGALGNLYDRLAYGRVVDFLHLHHWPVFNVADSCITVGALLLAWGLKDDVNS